MPGRAIRSVVPNTRKFLAAIQLTRLTIAFGAVSDIWFIILLSRAAGAVSTAGADGPTAPFDAGLLRWLFAGAIVAVGLFAYGTSLNDVLDVRHDATFSPERPIPAGRIKLSQAVVVAVGSLIVAVLAATSMGTWAACLTLLTAAAILFYNATGKYIPSIGIVTVGIVHAAHMFIPNHALAFTVPVWMVMTHTVVIAAAVHVLEDKRPRLDRRAIIIAGAGWLIWSVLILGLGVVRASAWPLSVPWAGYLYPAAAVAGFVLVAHWKTSRTVGRAAAEKLRRYGAMWQALYGATWLLALDLRGEALAIGIFAVVGFLVMTFLKELMGLTGRPIAFRA